MNEFPNLIRRVAGPPALAATLAAVLIAWSVLVFRADASPAGQAANPAKSAGFEQEILPIFEANCLRCHATAIKLGGMDLSTAGGVLAGSATGAVVEPGNPEASKLYNLVRTGAMPLDKQTKVSPVEMEKIRRWIAGLPPAPAGAKAKAAAPQDIAPVTMHASTLAATPAAQYRAVLDQYCVTCHNQQARTAGLELDKLDVAKVGEGAAVWEKVVDKLRAGAMPPAGMPRPDDATYKSFANYLETVLDQDAAAHPQPGRPAVHRLNRAEYTNAVRDLLALEIEGDALLPADDSGYGFDNIADVLSVSPMLMERYMGAAAKVSRLAIGDPVSHQVEETYNVPQFLQQDVRMSEDLPFGSRGGLTIHHNFPTDGDYVIKIRLRRSGDFHDERIIGVAEPHRIEVRLDNVLIKQFTVGGQYPDESPAGAAPKTPLKDTDDRYAHMTPRDRSEYTADAGLETRFHAQAGPRLVAIDFEAQTAEPEGPWQSHLAGFDEFNKRVKEILPAVDKVTLDGPFDGTGVGQTPSRRRIFLCRPSGPDEELPCARKILGTLARRPYRRPVTDRDVQPLLSLYKAGRTDGGFEAGIKLALRGILVSPEFLFRIERDPPRQAPGTAYGISDLELASRLSFFLWSSIPDDQLLDLAVQKKLHDPAVLEQQVLRMLADSRSQALVSNFAGQWLYLRNIRTALPDRVIFPEFDDNLRQAFQRETELFFASNLREDRSVLELLTANYTFVNERLARFYGIPDVYGSRFRRVTLPGDERRGLLGQGSILTVTSYANRTSPTERGKWVLENILGTPPPPPPPNVPSLKEDGDVAKVFTMRQRMEEHRKNPACAVCHTRMDPLGFALENFDGIGKWRSTEAGNAIDVSGALPDGVKFDGPEGLRKVLLSHPDQFAETVTRKLLTYALGRGLEYYDLPAVRKIAREAAPGNYRWSSLILGIAASVPFQMRMSKPEDARMPGNVVSQMQLPKKGSKP
jgi:mono/diheme cytochrome c family protein